MQRCAGAAVLPLFSACGPTCSKGEASLNALVVEIREAGTGAPAAYGATVVVRRGTVVDTIYGADQINEADSLRVARFSLAEVAGTYDLTVSKPGYASSQHNGVRVAERSIVCSDPVSRTVLAELARLP